MYLMSASSLCLKRSEAKALFTRSSCEGLHIAIVRPFAIAIVRKAVFINALCGSPKEIFDNPQIVASPFSLQYAIVESVSSAALGFAPIVATRPSTTMSSFVRPNL